MKIIRFFTSGARRTIKTGLTLKECQAHCSNPETSSTTAIGSRAKRRTRERGRWFDGFDYESKAERRQHEA